MPPYEYCAYCGAKLVDVYADRDESNLLESGERCPNGHYDYRYAYGNTEISIGDNTWTYGYQEEKADEQKRREEMTAAANALRQQLWDGYVKSRDQT